SRVVYSQRRESLHSQSLTKRCTGADSDPAPYWAIARAARCMVRAGCANYREVTNGGHTLGIQASVGGASRRRKPSAAAPQHSDGNRVRVGAAHGEFWRYARDRIIKSDISTVDEL